MRSAIKLLHLSGDVRCTLYTVLAIHWLSSVIDVNFIHSCRRVMRSFLDVISKLTLDMYWIICLPSKAAMSQFSNWNDGGRGEVVFLLWQYTWTKQQSVFVARVASPRSRWRVRAHNRWQFCVKFSDRQVSSSERCATAMCNAGISCAFNVHGDDEKY